MSESEMPRRRGPGRPREYASDADRARAWRARERVRRATFPSECDVGQVLEQLQTVTEQRDRNWEQVERLQVENARLRDGRTALTSPTEPSRTIDDLRPELDAAHHREVGWQQQAVDLLALLERLLNITGSDPLIREIGARSQLAAKHGELLGPSKPFDQTLRRSPASSTDSFPPPEPGFQPTEHLSRAERRRREREHRRRRRP